MDARSAIFMMAGPVGDCMGAVALLDNFFISPMLADHGYDVDWFRDALEEKEIQPCIPWKTFRREVKEKRKYKRRNCIEIICGSFKDWWRVADYYDRCLTVLLLSNHPATVMFWL